MELSKRMCPVEAAGEAEVEAAEANKKYRKVAAAGEAGEADLKVEAADEAKKVVGGADTYDAGKSALKTQCTSPPRQHGACSVLKTQCVSPVQCAPVQASLAPTGGTHSPSPVTPSEISGPDISSEDEEASQRLSQDAIAKHNSKNQEIWESLGNVAPPTPTRTRSASMEPMWCNCLSSEMITIAFQWISGDPAAFFFRRRDSSMTLKQTFTALTNILGMPPDQLQMVIDTQFFAHDAEEADDTFFSLNAVTRSLDKVSGGQEPLSLSVTLVYMNRHARS